MEDRVGTSANVQLEVQAPGRQRIQGTLGAPDQEATQIGFGVIAGGALEPGQGRRHCQLQLISERHKRIAGHWGQFGEVHHDPTLRLIPAAGKAAEPAPHPGCPMSWP